MMAIVLSLSVSQKCTFVHRECVFRLLTAKACPSFHSLLGSLPISPVYCLSVAVFSMAKMWFAMLFSALR